MYKQVGGQKSESGSLCITAFLCVRHCIHTSPQLIPKTMPERNLYLASASWDCRASGAELEVSPVLCASRALPSGSTASPDREVPLCRDPHPHPKGTSLKSTPVPRESNTRETWLYPAPQWPSLEPQLLPPGTMEKYLQVAPKKVQGVEKEREQNVVDSQEKSESSFHLGPLSG